MILLQKFLFVLIIMAQVSLTVCHAEESFHYLPDTQVVEIKPQMRPEPLTGTLYSLPSDNISVYLSNILLYDSKDQYDILPYVVAFDHDTSIAGSGDIAYTKGLKTDNTISSFSLLKPGRKLLHPDTGREIGYEVYVIGSAELQSGGKTQTILIKNAILDIDIGTRIIPSVGIDLPAVLDVRYPDQLMSGYVLSIETDGVGGGVYSIAVVSLGKIHGLKQGQVLNLMEGLREVQDPQTTKKVDLPTEKFGEILIYKVADKISLGIVTYAHRMVEPKDIVISSVQGDYE